MVVVDPNLLLHVIDLLLGGSPAKVADANEIVSRRGLTAVERRLFTHLTEVLSGTVTHAWDGLHELSLRPVRTETDAKHVAVFEPGEVVVDARFQVETAGCKGEIRFVLQQSSLRPLEKKLATGLLDSGSDEEADWVRPIMRLLRDVRVLSTAELGRTTIMLRELLGLKEGDVIRLDREPDNPITVFVEGTPKFLGLPTLQHGNLAVEVVSEISAKKPRSQQNTNGGQHE
jgi:flagellar motor switch protein FliM